MTWIALKPEVTYFVARVKDGQIYWRSQEFGTRAAARKWRDVHGSPEAHIVKKTVERSIYAD